MEIAKQCLHCSGTSFFLFSLVFFFSLFFLFVVLTEREDGIQNVGKRSADRIGKRSAEAEQEPMLNNLSSHPKFIQKL